MPYGFKLPGTDIVKVPNSGGGSDPTKLPLAGGTLSGLLNFSGTTHAGIRLNSLTTTQRNALTAGAGDFLLNTTLGQFQGYAAGVWGTFATLEAASSGGNGTTDSGKIAKFTSQGGINFGATVGTAGTIMSVHSGSTGYAIDATNNVISGTVLHLGLNAAGTTGISTHLNNGGHFAFDIDGTIDDGSSTGIYAYMPGPLAIAADASFNEKTSLWAGKLRFTDTDARAASYIDVVAATPTGARTATFVNETGNVITTGGVGTVTNTMLTGSISPSKVTGTAAILGANTFTGQQIISTNGAASTPPLLLNGTIFTGGSATTTKPQFLIEPTGTTSTGWKTTGTMLGVNAPSGFTGDLFSVQFAASLKVRIDYAGNIQWDAADNTVSIGRHGNGVQFCADGAFISKLTSTELRLTSAQACVWTDGSAYAGATVTSLRQSTGASVGSPCLQLGADAAGVTNQHFKACNRITSNGNGANLTISGGNGRGGAGGDLILASYTTAGSGVAGTLTTRWQMDAATGALLPGANATYNLGSAAAVLANVYSTDYYSGATKVVGAQQTGFAAVTGSPTSGIDTIDLSGLTTIISSMQTAINTCRDALNAHGLTTTV